MMACRIGRPETTIDPHSPDFGGLSLPITRPETLSYYLVRRAASGSDADGFGLSRQGWNNAEHCF